MTFSLDWKHGWKLSGYAKVEIVCTNLGGKFPIDIRYKSSYDDYWFINQCSDDGLIRNTNTRIENKAQPVEVKVVWVNMYTEKYNTTKVKSGGNYISRQEAESRAKGGKNYLGAFACTVEIPVGS